jgi:RNA polymerase sigma-32 factor
MSTYLSTLTSENSLVRYFEEIKKFPILSESEEKNLAYRWVEHRDVKAAESLITSHLRLVAKIATQFRGYGLPMVDMISEGNIGLMTAVKKFNPDLGYRLSTYAMWWIKATIQNFILKSWSIVKFGTSAAHKKLFFNLRKIKNKLLQLHKGSVPANETALIARELDVSEDDVRDMSSGFDSYDTSLNDPVYEENQVEQLDLVADDSQNQETEVINKNYFNYQKDILNNAMHTLTERERDIIVLRRLEETPKTLDEISRKYSISCERVRQIEDAAMKKLITYCKAV